MKVQEITIRNFRNLKEINLEPDLGINYIYGLNGVGKTNFIEALSYLSLGKSYKGVPDKIVIQNNCDFFYLKGNCENRHVLEIGVDQTKKLRQDNGIEIKRAADYVGILRSVIFSSRDLSIVTGTPQDKRRFLDLFLSQMDAFYLNSSLLYKRLLEQKNFELKKETIDRTYLHSLNWQMNTHMKTIKDRRYAFIEYLNRELGVIYRNLTSSDSLVRVEYQTNAGREFSRETENNEIRKRSATIGTHRDNITFFIDDLNATNYASQGQQRLLVLGVKILQVKYISERTGDVPIFLLDDLFSELDLEKSNRILSYLRSLRCQTFITTTEKSIDEPYIKYFKVENNEIKKDSIF